MPASVEAPASAAPGTRASAKRLRVALAHDWLVGLRGGERVLDAIVGCVRTFAEITALYVMFDDGGGVTPAIDALPKVVSRLGRLPGASARYRRWLLPLYPRAVEELSARLAEAHARSPIDLLISTSSAAIKGLRAPDGVPHVCYCHSPARYVWSQTDEYGGGPRGLGLRLAGSRFREWDRATSENVTRFIANSAHTAREIRRCYGREAAIVVPPARTGFFTPPPPGTRRGEHWLVVSALEPYKRVDLAIEAARLAGKQLRVVGAGSQERRLRTLAGNDARFLGRVSDEALREEYRSARLLLFPQVEDFGIVAVEAQACGLPVVARRAGGALDSVEDGVTGALFLGDSALSVIAGAARCPRDAAWECRRNAERFGEDRFTQALAREISTLLPIDGP